MADRPATLADILNRQFDEDQLRLICLELGLDYAQFLGSAKADRVQALLQFCAGQAIVNQLQRTIRLRFPQATFLEPATDNGERVRLAILFKKDIITSSDRRWQKELIQTLTGRFQIAPDNVHLLMQASHGPKGAAVLWLGMSRPDAERLATAFDRKEQTVQALQKGFAVQSVQLADKLGLDDKLATWQSHRIRGAIRLAAYLSGFPLLFMAGLLMAELRYQGGKSLLLWTLIGAVPAWIIWASLPLIAARFMRLIYSLRSGQEAFTYMFTCVFGPLIFNYPFVFIKEGKVDANSQTLPQGRTNGPGGPGLLIVFNDSAVVLERGGQRTTIIGPSVRHFGRLEKIQQVIDLRPQTRSTVASVLTRDGIPLKVKIEVTFRIRWQGEPTTQQPHPADPDALVQAAACEAVLHPDWAQPSIRNWAGRILGNLDSDLRSIVARYRLDELFEPTEPGLRPRSCLHDTYAQVIRNMASTFGAEVTDVHIDSFEFDNELIKQQWMETWQAFRASQARIIKAQAEADAIRTREDARRSAQLDMIKSMIREFQQIEDKKTVSASLITLRFVDAIRNMANSPEAGIFLPHEALQTLEGVQKLLESARPSTSGPARQMSLSNTPPENK